MRILYSGDQTGKPIIMRGAEPDNAGKVGLIASLSSGKYKPAVFRISDEPKIFQGASGEYEGGLWSGELVVGVRPVKRELEDLEDVFSPQKYVLVDTVEEVGVHYVFAGLGHDEDRKPDSDGNLTVLRRAQGQIFIDPTTKRYGYAFEKMTRDGGIRAPFMWLAEHLAELEK